MSTLSSRQRAYAAAYQTSRHSDKDPPRPNDFGLTKGNAQYVERRVREGRVDWSNLPELVRPPTDPE